MDGKCEGCGADMTIQRTHWDGCHTTHKQCAAFKAGREAGMREAANISAIFGDCANPLTNSHKTMVHLTASEIERAILSAIDK